MEKIYNSESLMLTARGHGSIGRFDIKGFGTATMTTHPSTHQEPPEIIIEFSSITDEDIIYENEDCNKVDDGQSSYERGYSDGQRELLKSMMNNVIDSIIELGRYE